MLVFLTASPMAAFRLGEDISGRTAGSGSDGAGEADRRNDGDEPNDDLRLVGIIGGSMGIDVVRGVPGFDGAGDAMAMLAEAALEWRCDRSGGGAGLLEEILRPGRSSLLNLPCVERVQVPSLSLRVYI